MKKQCPCGSGNPYDACCEPFHKGALPESALKLMPSRYSAYALCNPEYIIHTTHPASPQYSHDKAEWAKKISEFSKKTEFKKLEIIDFKENGSFATVTFAVTLFQNKKDVSYTEVSYFEKIKGKWLYRSGRLGKKSSSNLLPIAYYGNPILRKVAEPIHHITDDLCKLASDMIETMDVCDGIGLAAPQIHHSLKLFVIRQPVELEGGKIELRNIKVFINPELSDPSIETWKAEEGCVSIPSIHERVERPKEITVEYTDLKGKRIKERVSGWEARVIMHENDHINGTLFIDHLEKNEKENLEPLLKSLEKELHEGST